MTRGRAAGISLVALVVAFALAPLALVGGWPYLLTPPWAPFCGGMDGESVVVFDEVASLFGHWSVYCIDQTGQFTEVGLLVPYLLGPGVIVALAMVVTVPLVLLAGRRTPRALGAEPDSGSDGGSDEVAGLGAGA